MNQRLSDSRFLRACRRQAVDCTPVWLMRQAGRYMPEYRAVREKHALLTICKTPELAAEVTFQPLRRFNLDAAIIFADILLPIEPMGLKLEFAKGEGPVIANPISTGDDVQRLHDFEVKEHLGFVFEAIRLVVRELAERTPLIGFAGAPFTLAGYMIEGGHSRNFLKTKEFMYRNPEAWHDLLRKISTITSAYLREQVNAGASAVQLFDSWVGILSPDDYRNYVFPHSAAILKSLNAPTIHFSTGTGGYLEMISHAGGDVIGVDWRIPLDQAWHSFPDKAIQGNLDPAALLKPKEELKKAIEGILQSAGGRPGHIFNLGHGVYPETPVENVEFLVDVVHEFRSDQ
jgi:uroporphyrinogen decarboxylase